VSARYAADRAVDLEQREFHVRGRFEAVAADDRVELFGGDAFAPKSIRERSAIVEQDCWRPEYDTLNSWRTDCQPNNEHVVTMMTVEALEPPR